MNHFKGGFKKINNEQTSHPKTDSHYMTQSRCEKLDHSYADSRISHGFHETEVEKERTNRNFRKFENKEIYNNNLLFKVSSFDKQ